MSLGAMKAHFKGIKESDLGNRNDYLRNHSLKIGMGLWVELERCFGGVSRDTRNVQSRKVEWRVESMDQMPEGHKSIHI